MNVKQILAGFSVAVIALMTVPSAWSAPTTVTANIKFDTPLVVNKTLDIDYGSVLAATPDTYTISPTNVTSHTSSGAYLFGSPHAASISITGSGTDSLQILVGGYAGNNGVSVANATCKYGAAAAGSCNIPSAAPPTSTGTVLLVGADVTADGTQAAGSSAAPSFTLTITYN